MQRKEKKNPQAFQRIGACGFLLIESLSYGLSKTISSAS